MEEKTVNSGNGTESVVTDEKENVETELDDADDSSKTNEEGDDDLFDDTEEESVHDEKEKEKNEKRTSGKPNKLESHKYAEQRRLKEKEKQRQYNLGLKEGLGGINPYTKEEINDDYDLQVYKNMKEAEELGYDPVSEYWKYLASKDKKTFAEQLKAEQEERERADYVNKDIKAFETKYKDVDPAKLLKDERFQAFAEGKLGNKPLTEVYEAYVKFESFTDEKAKELAEKKFARIMSSSGSPENNTSHEVKGKSPLDMTPEELREYERRHKLHW